MSELQQSAQFFKALSEPVRLRILNLLLHSDAEICVCALIEALDIPQSVISRHLAYLRKAELVQARREGVWMHYSLHAQMPTMYRSVLAEFKRGSLSEPQLKADFDKIECVLCVSA